jgi:hypothetical protein
VMLKAIEFASLFCVVYFCHLLVFFRLRLVELMLCSGASVLDLTDLDDKEARMN